MSVPAADRTCSVPWTSGDRLSAISGRLTRAGADRQRCCIHSPFRKAPNVDGGGSPAPIRQLGSTMEDPSVHQSTSGS